ncbi:MAG: ABC transporter ATP-binding protein/permease [Stenomitos rutilans HA7619-LM2]|jgi:ABC-type multidrug transport system fused ATPase/permease subunit|nr:ABC transporter ATP-binding protein/permease [Stenomitos rutilans HA7619-LM2]
MKYLAKFLYVISVRQTELTLIIFLFLTISLLDAVGIGLVGPFIGLAVNPGLIQKNDILSSLYKYIGFQDTNKFIALLGLIIIVTFYLKSFFYYQIQNYVYKFCYARQVKLRLRLMDAYLSAPYTFHLRTNSAHILQNIGGESANFIYSIAIPLLNSVANGFVLLVLLLLLAKTDFVATVSVLGLLLVAIVPFHYFRHSVARWGKEGLEANTETVRITNHAIGGLKETKVIGCEEFFKAQLNGQTNKYAKAASRFHVFQLLPRIVVETLLITFVVGFVSLSLAFEQRAESLVSVLGIFAIASIRLMPSASQLIASMGLLRNNEPTLDRLYLDLKELEVSEARCLAEKTRGAALESFNQENSGHLKSLKTETLMFRNRITLDRISYCYPAAASNALKEVSLTIHKGESIALIGKSGAGKTSLVDVLLGLLIPQSGDIQVDGFSIYERLRSWQNLIGYIPQSIFLIDDTIAGNIAFGVPYNQIDQRKLDNAIRLAQLSELVAQLPEGIQTVVGERGTLLSGGQRQRIGIARALYHEREVLVLDEATSALDNETEQLISESIRSLSGTKTIIIIAHRLTTVKDCDRIYTMSKGQIINSGSYQEIVLGNQIPQS